ncbi:MAG: hypothetical protein JXN65_01090 [Clostridia bacterium]|nr:hypothetical protein [Clostridia bacterium]
MSNFYKHWFKGAEKAIEEMDEKGRDIFFSECGKACSESYTKQMYIDEYNSSENLDDFIQKLSQKFKDMKVARIDENTVEIKYLSCLCDLYVDGYISNPQLCLCSKKSLLYNWEAVLGEGRAKAEMTHSILSGDEYCRFVVKIRKE